MQGDMHLCPTKPAPGVCLSTAALTPTGKEPIEGR